MRHIFCLLKGDILFVSRKGKEEVILTEHARKRAREYNCGGRHSLCRHCALVEAIISCELAEHLHDEHFTLPAPLSREQAKVWTLAR